MLYTQLKAPLTLIITILAYILPRVFKSCLKKILRRPRNDLARCESTSTRPLQGKYYTLQIYSFSAILTFFEEPLCQRMGRTASRYSGGVCCIFQRPSSRWIRGLLFQNLTTLIWIHISFSASRPFPSPSRTSKPPESFNEFQRDSRYALYLDQFAVIRPHLCYCVQIGPNVMGCFACRLFWI